MFFVNQIKYKTKLRKSNQIMQQAVYSTLIKVTQYKLCQSN